MSHSGKIGSSRSARYNTTNSGRRVYPESPQGDPADHLSLLSQDQKEEDHVVSRSVPNENQNETSIDIPDGAPLDSSSSWWRKHYNLYIIVLCAISLVVSIIGCLLLPELKERYGPEMLYIFFSGVSTLVTEIQYLICCIFDDKESKNKKECTVPRREVYPEEKANVPNTIITNGIGTVVTIILLSLSVFFATEAFDTHKRYIVGTTTVATIISKGIHFLVDWQKKKGELPPLSDGVRADINVQKAGLSPPSEGVPADNVQKAVLSPLSEGVLADEVQMSELHPSEGVLVDEVQKAEPHPLSEGVHADEVTGGVAGGAREPAQVVDSGEVDTIEDESISGGEEKDPLLVDQQGIVDVRNTSISILGPFARVVRFLVGITRPRRGPRRDTGGSPGSGTEPKFKQL